MLETELFGLDGNVGKLELANNGTLLLDEITETDLSFQAKQRYMNPFYQKFDFSVTA